MTQHVILCHSPTACSPIIQYYTSIHESMTSDVDRFKENVEARMSSQDLIIAEYETDKIQQLELEEFIIILKNQ